MYSINHIEDLILANFSNRAVFKRGELMNFVRTLDPGINTARLNYIVVSLKKKNKLRDIGKGVYSLVDRKEFRPEPDERINKLAGFLKRVPGLESIYSIWTTDWLNEFLELQAITGMYILELEKQEVQRVFFALKDEEDNLALSFLNPSKEVIENYVAGLPFATIVRPLITRAPVQTIGEITYPTLEKMLVDLFCDTDLFFAYQGSQLIHIFDAALSKYSINFSRLLNYAKRRNREEEFRDFLLKHTNTQTEINSTKK